MPTNTLALTCKRSPSLSLYGASLFLLVAQRWLGEFSISGSQSMTSFMVFSIADYSNFFGAYHANNPSKFSGPQCKGLPLVACISTIWVIWLYRNKVRHKNLQVHTRTAINLIHGLICESGPLITSTLGTSANDLSILRIFRCTARPRRVPKITPVFWHPPLRGWTKINTDGSSHGIPGSAGCGDLFTDYNGIVSGCFVGHIGIASSVIVEFFAVIYALEIATYMGWPKIWLECDSMLVIHAFQKVNTVPSEIRTR
ncbi:Ribonuclease H domain [Macleaya cordata]|uniref:Ribonuclease H domain n=1 Tax=Macleaya cordata TaxID=56857 RepID=A0A200Q5R4_MACCD|nr:Ribonuclease H domain [Macleaya cordata]